MAIKEMMSASEDMLCYNNLAFASAKSFQYNSLTQLIKNGRVLVDMQIRRELLHKHRNICCQSDRVGVDQGQLLDDVGSDFGDLYSTEPNI